MEDIKLLKATMHVKYILNYFSSMENKGTGKRESGSSNKGKRVARTRGPWKQHINIS